MNDNDLAKIKEKYNNFQERFGVDALTNSNNEQLLNLLFGTENSLKRYFLRGGEYYGFPAFGKTNIYPYFYPVYYVNNGRVEGWVRGGTRQRNEDITEDDLLLQNDINQIVDETKKMLLALFNLIQEQIDNHAFNDINGYKPINNFINENKQNYPWLGYDWLHKYIHMLYPKYFASYYSEEYQSSILNLLQQNNNIYNSKIMNMGLIAIIANRRKYLDPDISTVQLASEYYNSLTDIEHRNDFKRYLNNNGYKARTILNHLNGLNTSFNINIFNIDKPGEVEKTYNELCRNDDFNKMNTDKKYETYFNHYINFLNNDNQPIRDDNIEGEDDNIEGEDDNLQNGCNKIYYGTPGCGKSYKVKTDYENDKYEIFRTIFYPDYSNADFVGQIIPKSENGQLKYKFVPGPFTNALAYALSNKDKKVALIIEEINRGNASAIFGEIFQLLDRDENHKSEYTIINDNIIDYLKEKIKYKEESIYIPSNMSIIATMNTSDQNIYPLDTAFQRRWDMVRIRNSFKNQDDVYVSNKANKLAETIIDGTNVNWQTFVEKVNDRIANAKLGSYTGEDKQLGIYFVKERELENKTLFSEKVIKYLWNDVAKINPSDWFKPEFQSLDKAIDGFIRRGVNIFVDDLFGQQN